MIPEYINMSLYNNSFNIMRFASLIILIIIMTDYP